MLNKTKQNLVFVHNWVIILVDYCCVLTGNICSKIEIRHILQKRYPEDMGSDILTHKLILGVVHLQRHKSFWKWLWIQKVLFKGNDSSSIITTSDNFILVLYWTLFTEGFYKVRLILLIFFFCEISSHEAPLCQKQRATGRDWEGSLKIDRDLSTFMTFLMEKWMKSFQNPSGTKNERKLFPTMSDLWQQLEAVLTWPRISEISGISAPNCRVRTNIFSGI